MHVLISQKFKHKSPVVCHSKMFMVPLDGTTVKSHPLIVRLRNLRQKLMNKLLKSVIVTFYNG